MEQLNQNEKRHNVSTGAQNTLGALAIFNHNSHFEFIYKKTEKLVTAVYMITNFIKDNEPLKWKIRDNALSLMALNISFNTVALSERKDLIRKYQAISLEIVSLSGIAYHSGLISEMNYTILAREFTSLVSILEKDENKKASEETVLLHPGFFNVETSASDSHLKDEQTLDARHNQASEKPVHMYKGHVSNAHASEPHAQETHKPEYLPVKDIVSKPLKTTDSKNDRQSIIIKLLSKKSGLSINDFTDSIKGVSAKTIQRELLSMVASGVLKKEGERRWSTYSLAQ